MPTELYRIIQLAGLPLASTVTEKSNFFTDLRIARALDQMEFRNDKGELITITPEQRRKIIDIVKQHGYSAELIDYFKKIGIPEYEPDQQHAEFLFKLDPEIRKKHKTVQDFQRSQDYRSRKAQSTPAKKKIDHFHPYTRAQYAQGISDMQLRNRRGELTQITPEQIEEILDIIEVHGFGAELENYLKKIKVIGKYATVESLREAPATPAQTITPEQFKKILDIVGRLSNRLYQLWKLSQKEAPANTIQPEQIKKILDSMVVPLSSQIYDLFKQVFPNKWLYPSEVKSSQQPVNSSVDNTPGGMNKNMPTDLNRMRKLAGLQQKPANKPIMINGKPVDVDSIEIELGNDGPHLDYKDLAIDAMITRAFFKDGTELSDAEIEQLHNQEGALIFAMAMDMQTGGDSASLYR